MLMLNLATDVINFWQDEAKKHTIDEAREKYPQVQFQVRSQNLWHSVCCMQCSALVALLCNHTSAIVHVMMG